MNRVLNKSWFSFDKKEETRESIILIMLALLIPMFLGKLISLVFGENSLVTSNSQVIIGTIVNSLLIVSALNIKGIKKIIGVIIVPSVASVLGGYLFGSASVAMVWMIPGIWVGNLIFVYVFKKLMIEKKINYFLTGLCAVTFKSLIIFGVFSLLNAFGVFPSSVIDTIKYSMGIMQGFTGILGLLLGYLIYTSYRY